MSVQLVSFVCCYIDASSMRDFYLLVERKGNTLVCSVLRTRKTSYIFVLLNFVDAMLSAQFYFVRRF